MMPAMNGQDMDIPPEFARLLKRSGMEAHYRTFASYARGFYTGEPEHDALLDLKAEHSRNVFRHAHDMSLEAGIFAASAPLGRALLLAGLYHDLGRFPQYAQYRTFSDPQSVNHAHLSVREVKRLGFLGQEDDHVRGAALAAIAMHNRFAMPAADKDALLVGNALRDADKLDIMRIMADHLTGALPDAVVVLHAAPSQRVTPAVLEAVLARRLASYADLVTTTDFALLVCGWLYDLNFPWSRRAAVAGGYLGALFASLPRTRELAPFREQFSKDMSDYGRSA